MVHRVTKSWYDQNNLAHIQACRRNICKNLVTNKMWQQTTWVQSSLKNLFLMYLWNILKQSAETHGFICYSLFCWLQHPFALVAQLLCHVHPTLLNPMDGSPPGSSVHWISHTNVLEWVSIFFSRESSCSGMGLVSPALASTFFTAEPPGKTSMQISFLSSKLLFLIS